MLMKNTDRHKNQSSSNSTHYFSNSKSSAFNLDFDNESNDYSKIVVVSEINVEFKSKIKSNLQYIVLYCMLSIKLN